MKFKILTVVALTALLGMNVSAQWSDLSSPLAYVNVNEASGTTPGAFIYGQPIGIADLIAATGDNLNFVAQPNTLFYSSAVTSTNDADREFWTDSPDGGVTAGPDGNKVLEHIFYYETAQVPPGTTNLVLSYTVNSITLSNRYTEATYEPKAVIKKFTQGYTSFVREDAILAPGSGSISFAVDALDWGYPVQLGFEFFGLNANPADDWGQLDVTVDLAFVDYTGQSNTPPPTPTWNQVPTGVSDQQVDMSVNPVEDDATAVEYLFTNLTFGSSSGWTPETTWSDKGLLLSGTTGTLNKISQPNFAVLDGPWEGWNADGAGATAPSTFVTVVGNTAQVTPPAVGTEFSFYTTFGPSNGSPPLDNNQGYIFKFITTDLGVGAQQVDAFVKGFNSGWGEDVAWSQYLPCTLDGSEQTIEFFTDGNGSAATYIQVGFRSQQQSGSDTYGVFNPRVYTVDRVFSGLPPETTNCYTVYARDVSPYFNESDPAVTNCASTLEGDTTPPSPDPATFADAGSGSAISAKMTATPATDASPVEYYFEALTAGANDSGWISTNVYTDYEIASDATYDYRVRVRDLSFFGNTNEWSVAPVSISTLPFPASDSFSDALTAYAAAGPHEFFLADLQLGAYEADNPDSAIAFAFFGATFGTAADGDAGRNVIRTLPDSYDNANLEVYVQSFFVSTNVNTFIGIGPGELGAFGVPDWSPRVGDAPRASFIAELTTSNLVIWSQENAVKTNDNYDVTTNVFFAPMAEGIFNWIKLDYDAFNNEATVSIDFNNSANTPAGFTADVTLGPIPTPAFVDGAKAYVGSDDGGRLKFFQGIVGAAPSPKVENLVITDSDGTTATLQWTGLSGQTYSIVYKTNLTSGVWTADGPNTSLPGVDGVNSTTSTAGGDEVFFKVLTD